MASKFELEDGDFGQRLVLTSEWSQQYYDYMRQNEISEININYARGFMGSSIEFLKSLTYLKCLMLISYHVKDITPINALNELKSLSLSCVSQSEIDFHNFPALERCTLMREIRHCGLSDLKHLKYLSIVDYKERSMSPLLTLTSLNSLILSNSPVDSIEGVSKLRDLKELTLANFKRLSTIHGIEHLENLETLEINMCRNISSIEDLTGLKPLRKLLLLDCGDIQSLNPIADLSKLEMVVFYGSTNIADGDLSVLEQLPNLKTVSFQNRKHYSHAIDLQTRTLRKK